MNFDSADTVDMLCYQLRLADYTRGQNRARINNLFNGCPPYSDDEVRDNNIAVNVNYLEGTRIAHEARTQFYNAFLKPGHYFKASTDMGAAHKRVERNGVITEEINKIMKRSLPYYECFRSKFASDVLHGVGAASWKKRDLWRPDPIGIEDVLIPANTLLTMENVPFFAIYRSLTAPEIIKLAKCAKPDRGWNMKLVNRLLEWVDKETLQLLGSNWPEVWSPEKMGERVKSDGGFYVGDQVPTIDMFDFYFWNDSDKHAGWNRRIILDAWSNPGSGGSGEVKYTRKVSSDGFDWGKGDFLFNPGKRKYADKMQEIVCFQFADLSAVSPFRYHSVRSLGFLLYAVCHLQNRMRCKFSESVFEALMMYFRVKGLDDVQRALKLDLINRGFIDESLTPVPATERYQVNTGLVELGLKENATLIQQSSASYSAQPNMLPDKVQKNKMQVLQELQAMTSLVASALMQAYSYQTWEYREIFRRFCMKDSSDPDVMKFRAACVRQGVPERLLQPQYWEIEPERIMGAGNKTLEMAISEALMAVRHLYDPPAQRQILRDYTLNLTEDPGRAGSWVPEEPVVSDSLHDAQLRWGTLMLGGQIAPKPGTNHIEVIEALLGDLSQNVQQIKQMGGMTTMDKVMGFFNVANHVTQEIQMLSEDKEEKARVKQYGDALGKLMNEVKGFAQRIQEQQKAQQAQGAGADPKDMAKLQIEKAKGDIKLKNMRESHAQRTAQRQIQFEMETKRDQQKLQNELAMEQARHQQELMHEHVNSAHELAVNRIKALQEPPPTNGE